MPVTAGRALALATVPTMMFCLSPLNWALADDYFDPAALEFADPQQQTSDLHLLRQTRRAAAGHLLCHRGG